MPSTATNPIRVVCISDTHGAEPSVPDGDILIHAGDLTSRGTADELRRAVEWISTLPHPVKLVIGGNHDRGLDAKLQKTSSAEDLSIDWPSLGITYLEHSSTQITVNDRELHVFGSPYTPEYGRFAFQYPQARLLPERAREVWQDIPLNTNILITHGPPLGHLDMTSNGQLAGCAALRDKLWEIRPVLHVFGHIHEGRGKEAVEWGVRQKIKESWAESNKRLLSTVSRLAKVVGSSGASGSSRRSTVFVNASIRPSHFSGMPLNEPEVVII